MSAQALQRMVVRMLYDPALVVRVYARYESALEGAELSEAEKSWLLQPDRRAFGADLYRRGRSLQGLLEEYPASFALANAQQLAWEELDAFFSSPRFHAAVQAGRSMALIFGEHLLELAERHSAQLAWLGPLAELERGLARVRRRIPHAEVREGRWNLSPHVELLSASRGTLATHQLVSGRLGDPDALDFENLLDATRLESLRLTPRGKGTEHLLLILGEAGQVRIEPLTPELFAILEGARGGATREELVKLCRSLGADEEQAEEILHEFSQSGELRSPRKTDA